MVAALHVKLQWIQKKIYEEGAVNIPILSMRKLRHRDLMKSIVNESSLVSVFMDSKLFGKGHGLSIIEGGSWFQFHQNKNLSMLLDLLSDALGVLYALLHLIKLKSHEKCVINDPIW